MTRYTVNEIDKVHVWFNIGNIFLYKSDMIN